MDIRPDRPRYPDGRRVAGSVDPAELDQVEGDEDNDKQGNNADGHHGRGSRKS
jgi:hypothetical protein